MIEYTVRVYGDRTEWWLGDQLHREGNLPAIEWADGSKSYWLEGKQLTKKEWQERVNPTKELTIAEIEKLLGHKVKVVK